MAAEGAAGAATQTFLVLEEKNGRYLKTLLVFWKKVELEFGMNKFLKKLLEKNVHCQGLEAFKSTEEPGKMIEKNEEG